MQCDVTPEEDHWNFRETGSRYTEGKRACSEVHGPTCNVMWHQKKIIGISEKQVQGI